MLTKWMKYKPKQLFHLFRYFRNFCKYEISKRKEIFLSKEFFSSTVKKCHENKERVDSLVQEMKTENKEEPFPPDLEAPTLEDCCQGGCDNCVFNVYYEKLEKYQKYLEIKKKKES